MKLKFSLLPIIAIFVMLGVVAPVPAGAVSPSSILISIVPQNPAPNENVTISLNSYVSNLDSVVITWSVNGQTAISETGKKTFSLTAPDAGQETSVVASIALPDGTIDTRIIIRPTVMVLLWQANDSHVPPFYRGKALPTPDSEIKVVAMPEIRSGSGIVNPKNMTYSWRKDYTNDQQAGGYGKNYFTYVNDYLEDSSNVEATASTTDQKYSSRASIDINTSEPKILFYRNDPEMGTIWEHALTNGYVVEDALIIEAIPYFISPSDINIPILSWIWSINDNLVNVEGVQKNLMPVAVQAGISGTSKIRLEISNLYKIFSGASKEITVSF
jgi:hypothetical protein